MPVVLALRLIAEDVLGDQEGRARPDFARGLGFAGKGTIIRRAESMQDVSDRIDSIRPKDPHRDLTTSPQTGKAPIWRWEPFEIAVAALDGGFVTGLRIGAAIRGVKTRVRVCGLSPGFHTSNFDPVHPLVFRLEDNR